MHTIIITGSNSGIGKEAALHLANSGHRVLMACRDSEKSRQAQKEIAAQSKNENVLLFPLDLANPNSIRAFAGKVKSQFPVIDVLINNAGVYKAKKEETEDGVEMNFAVNFLAPFMLSEMLLENLEASGNGRVINVVSELYKKGSINFNDVMMKTRYNSGTAYANSKLATVLYTNKLASKVKNKGITVNALHPGVLATNVFQDYPSFLMKIVKLFLEKPQRGGERIAYLAVSDKVKTITGRYFYKTDERELVIPAREQAKTEELLGIAKELTGLKK